MYFNTKITFFTDIILKTLVFKCILPTRQLLPVSISIFHQLTVLNLLHIVTSMEISMYFRAYNIYYLGKTEENKTLIPDVPILNSSLLRQLPFNCRHCSFRHRKHYLNQPFLQASLSDTNKLAVSSDNMCSTIYNTIAGSCNSSQVQSVHVYHTFLLWKLCLHSMIILTKQESWSAAKLNLCCLFNLFIHINIPTLNYRWHIIIRIFTIRS